VTVNTIDREPGVVDRLLITELAEFSRWPRILEMAPTDIAGKQERRLLTAVKVMETRIVNLVSCVIPVVSLIVLVCARLL